MSAVFPYTRGLDARSGVALAGTAGMMGHDGAWWVVRAAACFGHRVLELCSGVWRGEAIDGENRVFEVHGPEIWDVVQSLSYPTPEASIERGTRVRPLQRTNRAKVGELCDVSVIDLDNLLRTRLIVARVGEMDLARWWDTKGMLGKTGRLAVSRGLPKTHRFAQARAVFAVARARCRDVYSPPDGVTLWDLPAEIESAFDERWPLWIENQPAWRPFFDALEATPGDDLVGAFARVAPLPAATLDAAKRMKRAADQKAVPLGEVPAVTDELVSQLAVGFSKGEPGRVAVPFAKVRRAG